MTKKKKIKHRMRIAEKALDFFFSPAFGGGFFFLLQIGFAYRLPKLANGCPFGMCDEDTGTTVTSLCQIIRDVRVLTE